MTSSIELRFTPDAQQDIDQIQQYTFTEWGRDQMERYQSMICESFERIRLFPDIGSRHDDGTREYPMRHHVILYRHDAKTVTILRVMHPRRLRD
ncbi:MAG: type II toxin-antitoxin system RelE/ParE family toxin [Thermomicrobiales bacterium]